VSRILVDFDGTLCPGPYTSRFECNGKPTPEAVQFINDALAAGFEVIVFTARLSEPGSAYNEGRIRMAIEDWCSEHFDGWHPHVTAEKHPGIIIDDNAYRFEGYWPDIEVLKGHGRFGSAAAYKPEGQS
jgi:hypothetical protein